MEITRNPPKGLTNSKKWSSAFNAFVGRCLTVNPDHRPSAEELLSDPFILSVSNEGARMLLAGIGLR